MQLQAVACSTNKKILINKQTKSNLVSDIIKDCLEYRILFSQILCKNQ